MSEARSAPTTAGPLTPPSPALQKLAGAGHIGTMKSMSLLHELQEYMLSTEGAKAELETLRKEKQRLEKELRKSVDPPLPPRTARGIVGQSVAEFTTTDDLPPRLRAIIEDNRVLKETNRRSKQQLKEYETAISSQNDQILRLQDELKKLRVLTQGRQVDEKTMQELQQLKTDVLARDMRIRDLQAKVDVLEKARVTDQKKANGQVQQALKDREAAVMDMKMTQLALEDKDKEHRKALIKIRELQRQLDPLKNLEALQKKQAEDEKRLTALRADVEEKIKVLEEPRVFVMLCLIEDSSGGRKRNQSLKDATSVMKRRELSEGEAATRIQAAFRGHKTRLQLAEQRRVARSGPTAIKLEAGDEVLAPEEPKPEPDHEEAAGARTSAEGEDDPAATSTSAPAAEEAPAAAAPEPSTPVTPLPMPPPAHLKTGPRSSATKPIASQATSGTKKPAARKGQVEDEGEFETVARKATRAPTGGR